MSEGVIYGLCGPEGIRYVGQTRRTLMKRWRCHRYDAERGRDLWVYRWWRSLDKPPRPVLLERCAIADLNEREVYWIARLRAEGAKLCNLTTGGDTGTSVSRETRARLSASLKGRPSPTKGMTMSEETRALLSSQRRGTPRSAAWRASISAGLRASKKAQEQRERLATSQIGRKRSPESRARMSAAQRRRYGTT